MSIGVPKGLLFGWSPGSRQIKSGNWTVGASTKFVPPTSKRWHPLVKQVHDWHVSNRAVDRMPPRRFSNWDRTGLTGRAPRKVPVTHSQFSQHPMRALRNFTRLRRLSRVGFQRYFGARSAVGFDSRFARRRFSRRRRIPRLPYPTRPRIRFPRRY